MLLSALTSLVTYDNLLPRVLPLPLRLVAKGGSCTSVVLLDSTTVTTEPVSACKSHSLVGQHVMQCETSRARAPAYALQSASCNCLTLLSTCYCFTSCVGLTWGMKDNLLARVDPDFLYAGSQQTHSTLSASCCMALSAAANTPTSVWLLVNFRSRALVRGCFAGGTTHFVLRQKSL